MTSSRLELKSLEDVAAVITRLKERPNFLTPVKVIHVEFDHESELGSDEKESKNTEQIQGSSDPVGSSSTLCADITEIIESIAKHSTLEDFQWEFYDGKTSPRPEAFWIALAKTSSTLKALRLGFAEHEIHKLREKKIDPFPTPMQALESLVLDLSGGHGDNAEYFDRGLHHMKNLRSLELDLPSCDLENCRIQGLTYEWDFPQLAHLSISAYYGSSSDILNFVNRHRKIEFLHFNVEFEEPFQFSPSVLPSLRALSVGYSCSDDNARELVATRSIAAFRFDTKFHNISTLKSLQAEKLRCLELDSLSWEDLAVKSDFVNLLPTFVSLEEFGLEFQSEDTTWTDDNDCWVHPEPLKATDLESALDVLSSIPTLRAIRMTDRRSSPLPTSFTESLPSCIPSILEYIQWGDEGSRTLFKIERIELSGGTKTAKAVELDDMIWTGLATIDLADVRAPLRAVPGKRGRGFWGKTSILDHSHGEATS
ncbi:hypothetical protein EJ08DRAFT_694242 [Tothia fuscella]|uniref:Uncharacterized protein n=1 Tax=Tothia fuscella TaxID=1048955 RepID=A0A9P4U0N2_9PEZI|nr:hypothetical protein EJ08DRAFT_694242 [Tothia fuscella]